MAAGWLAAAWLVAGWLAVVALLTPVSGALADPLAFTVTASPPAGSVIVAAGDGSFAFVVAGAAPAGGSVVLSATVPPGGLDAELCSTVADAGDDWSCTVTAGPDTPGPLRVVSGADELLLDVALLHPPVITTDPATPGALPSTGTPEAPAQTITGTGAPGALLTLSVSDGSGCTTTVGDDGTWACVLGSLPVGADVFTLVASQAYPFAPGTAAESDPVAFVPSMTTIIPGGPVDPPLPPTPPVPPAPGSAGVGTPADSAPDTIPPVIGTDPGSEGGAGAGAAPGGETGDPANDATSAAARGGTDGGDGRGGRGDRSGRDGLLTDPSGGDEAALASGVGDGAADSSVRLVRPGDGAVGLAGGSFSAGDGSSKAGREGSGGSGASDSPGALAAGDGATDSGAGDAAGERFGFALRDVNAVLSLPPASVVFAGLLVGGLALLVWLPGGLLESTLHENHPRIRRSPPVRYLTALSARFRLASSARAAQARPESPSRAAHLRLASRSRDAQLLVASRSRAAQLRVALASRGAQLRVASPSRGAQLSHPSRALAALGGRLPQVAAAGAAVVVAAGAGVVVVPGAGFDAEGVRTFLCFLVALVVVNAVPLVAAGGFVARRTGAGAVPTARWTALGLTVLTVLGSRAAGLEPGFVFGTVIALQFGIRLTRPMAARATVIATTASLTVGVLAWVAASALLPGVGASAAGADAGSVGGAAMMEGFGSGGAWAGLLVQVLTAVTVCALSGPVVSLLPMRFLDGHGLFAASKRVWAVLYAVAATLFVVVLLPLPSAWSELGGDLAAWLIALALATALSLGVWAYFRFVPERLSPQDDRPTTATPETSTPPLTHH